VSDKSAGRWIATFRAAHQGKANTKCRRAMPTLQLAEGRALARSQAKAGMRRGVSSRRFIGVEDVS
jgi:hypothetical protein